LTLDGEDRDLVSSIATPVESPLSHVPAAGFGPDGNGTAESRIPLTGYASQREGQGILGGLIDRWR
jgi:hypothetical protein